MKTNRVVGERVEFLTDGCFGEWENKPTMKGHNFTDCYGIRQKDGNFFIYSKKTDERLSLTKNINTTWCFFDDEVKVVSDPNKKPSTLSRLYTAIAGALFGSYHRDRYQDGER